MDPNIAPLTTPLQSYGFKHVSRPLAILLSGFSRKVFNKLLAEGILITSIGGRKKSIRLVDLDHLRGTPVTVHEFLVATKILANWGPESSSVYADYDCHPGHALGTCLLTYEDIDGVRTTRERGDLPPSPKATPARARAKPHLVEPDGLSA
jgi:hypothetical protein